jgi:double-stranded uracil-DNA glycosylase
LNRRIGHRARAWWLGKRIWTLEDVIPPHPLAVCVGINPAPLSVAVGHYYQGDLGKRFCERLRWVGLLPSEPGWEDDAGVGAGIGFTDIVKRPTARVEDVHPEDYEFGRALLEKKLAEIGPRLVIFTFKRAAEKFFGDFEGNGFVRGLAIGSARVFVMPGPMEERIRAERTLRQLRRAVQAMRSGKKL